LYSLFAHRKFIISQNSARVRVLLLINQTVRFGIELSRNITMKLGYANAKIYKCNNPRCLAPGCYKSYGSDKEDRPKCERPDCGGTYILQRYVAALGIALS